MILAVVLSPMVLSKRCLVRAFRIVAINCFIWRRGILVMDGSKMTHEVIVSTEGLLRIASNHSAWVKYFAFFTVNLLEIMTMRIQTVMRTLRDSRLVSEQGISPILNNPAVVPSMPPSLSP
jgi:hypothetical protein